MNSKHVFLLSIDALRMDHLSYAGYERETSPVLDEFAAENVSFTDAHSASSHTREAVPSLLTGEYPSAAVDERYTLSSPTIARRMKDASYDTGGFHSNPYASRAYGFGDGFDEFDDDLYYGRSRLIALLQRAFDMLRDRHYAPAEVINERSVSWLDGRDGPLFLWNHYMDPHGPYAPTGSYRGLFGSDRETHDPQKLYRRAAVKDPGSITAGERQTMIDRYDEEIRYVDASLGGFFEELRQRDLWEDSLVVVTADHGDAFGEYGWYGHPRYPKRELTHVPLVVSAPGLSAGDVDVPVSTIDVVPTILDFVGLPHDELPGISLFEVATDRSAFEDRYVYASARGEGDDDHLRRFAGISVDSRCSLVRNRETGGIVTVDTADSSRALESALREHSRGRTTGEAGSGDGEAESAADLDRRLSALGYKE
jgi:arylsulfatase